jgi:hypothetical protein
MLNCGDLSRKILGISVEASMDAGPEAEHNLLAC